MCPVPPEVHPDRSALGALDAAGIGHDPDALRGAVERLAEEVVRLRWALREACDTAWSDGEAAMAQYLRRAETAALDESLARTEPSDG